MLDKIGRTALNRAKKGRVAGLTVRVSAKERMQEGMVVEETVKAVPSDWLEAQVQSVAIRQ